MARMKVILAFLAPISLGCVILVAGLMFEYAIRNTVNVMETELRERGLRNVDAVSQDISYAYARDGMEDVKEKLRLFMSTDRDTPGVTLFTSSGQVYASRGDPIPPAIAGRLQGRESHIADGELYYSSAPVKEQAKVLGYAVIMEHHNEAAVLRKNTPRALGFTVFSVLFLGVVAASLWFAGRITRPIERMTGFAQAVASGDLTRHAPDERMFREVRDLAVAVETIAGALRAQSAGMQKVADGIMESSSQLAASTSQLAATAGEQAASIAESTSTAEEIKQTGKTSAKNAHEIVEVAEKSVEVSREGLGAVDSSTVEIRRLREQVESMAGGVEGVRAKVGQVMEIIRTVKEIAEQSNLLAVNASIEAAKAGEFGRGFSVVALEVRSLADQSKRATGQVRETLGSMQSAIEEAVVSARAGSERAESSVRTMEHTGAVIRRLSEVIAKTADSARVIAISANEQSVGFEQIAQAMSSIHQAANENMESMHHVEQSCEQLSQLAAQLHRTVGKYRLN